MARAPFRDDPRDPWRDHYRPSPADAPWPEATVTEKDPAPVLYGPKGQPLPSTRPPERFGFHSRKAMR